MSTAIARFLFLTLSLLSSVFFFIGTSAAAFGSFTESTLETFLMFSSAFSYSLIADSDQRTWASVLYVVYYMIAPILMVREREIVHCVCDVSLV